MDKSDISELSSKCSVDFYELYVSVYENNGEFIICYWTLYTFFVITSRGLRERKIVWDNTQVSKNLRKIN